MDRVSTRPDAYSIAIRIKRVYKKYGWEFFANFFSYSYFMEFNSKFVLIYYFKFPFYSFACSKHLAATPAVPDRNDSMRLR